MWVDEVAAIRLVSKTKYPGSSPGRPAKDDDKGEENEDQKRFCVQQFDVELRV